jgi:hypothetical protein
MCRALCAKERQRGEGPSLSIFGRRWVVIVNERETIVVCGRTVNRALFGVDG